MVRNLPKSDHPPKPNLSKSSISEFNDCERRWALHHCWYDFDYFEFPDDLKRECQFHARLMSNEAFAGQVVHDVIDEALRGRVEGRFPLEPYERAKEIAAQYIAESRQFVAAYQSGAKAPKLQRQPLFRLFFNEGFDGHAKAEFRKTVEFSLLNFFDSELFKSIEAIDPAYYEFPPHGGSPWFLDGAVPIYANFDFALRMPEETVLFDWKTGKVSRWSEQDVRSQLHTYAAYALTKWKTPPDQLRLRAVWLGAGLDQVYEVPFSLEYLNHMRGEWRERYKLLRDRRERAKGDLEKLFELFPATGVKKKTCRSCSFRFCEGYQEYLAKVAETPMESGKIE